MMLADVRDFIASLGVAEDKSVYMGKLENKKQKSIGVYNSKHEHAYKCALGGKENESYGSRFITLLVHWNKSCRETETASMELFSRLEETRETAVNGKKIKFIRLLTDPVDLGTDQTGVYETVIETEIIYERQERK